MKLETDSDRLIYFVHYLFIQMTYQISKSLFVLDSIGTVFIASTLGPIYGMLPNVISGLFMGMTVDVYSLYYAPVGIILGLVTGLVYQKYKPKKWWIFVAALVITLPSTIVSSCITAFLFGGITSSGSTVLVQLLAKTPMGMVGACFVVQFFTDYIDLQEYEQQPEQVSPYTKAAENK